MKLWAVDYSDERHVSAILRDAGQLAGIQVLSGIRLAGVFPSNLSIEIDSKRPPTDFLKVGKLWIISLRLKSILEHFGVEAEYFPITLFRKKNGQIFGGWFCFNPTLIRDWYDRSKSQFTLEKDFATDLVTVVVNTEKFGDAPLAVSAKTIPRLICVCDDLACAILSKECTGLIFYAPADWQNPEYPRK